MPGLALAAQAGGQPHPPLAGRGGEGGGGLTDGRQHSLGSSSLARTEKQFCKRLLIHFTLLTKLSSVDD